MSTPPNPKDDAEELRQLATKLANLTSRDQRTIAVAILALTAELRCVRDTLDEILNTLNIR